MNFDNLVNEAVEKRRMQYSFSELIVSPEMKEIGIGDIKDDRMARAIGIVVEGYQLTARAGSQPRSSRASSCRPRPSASWSTRRTEP